MCDRIISKHSFLELLSIIKNICVILSMGQKSGKHKKDLTHLSDDDIDRLTKNTTYTRQQIIDWHQGFLRYEKSKKLL